MQAAEPAPGRVRIDKWLWAARFFRTRSLAAEAVESGQVRVGDRVVVRKEGLVWEVEVTGLSERRGSAAEAARLYRESDLSAAARETEIARRRAERAAAPRFDGRPTKRDRRRLQDFLDEP